MAGALVHCPMRGVLHSINISRGLPKQPVTAARVHVGGVAGDSQRNRVLHGGPDRAVCLYSLDRIHALQAEGHPIAPGVTGDNLTIAGIDWSAVRPGARLEIGDVLLEVTGFATPCRKIAVAFRDGQFTRISDTVHRGWSRVYARVLIEGELETGLSVRLIAARPLAPRPPGDTSDPAPEPGALF